MAPRLAENLFDTGLDTWLVATGQVPAPAEPDGLLRTMAVVLLGEEWLGPEMVGRLLPIGPWASRDEALRDDRAWSRLRELTEAEKQDVRRALFGARKYLARFEGQEVAERDPREGLFHGALENLQARLAALGWETETAVDDGALRAVVEATHPWKDGPVLRFIVSCRDVVVTPRGFTATAALDGGCVRCVRAQQCAQSCPFYGWQFCQIRTHGIGWHD